MGKSLFSVRTKYLMLAAATGLVGGMVMVNAPVLAQTTEEITVTAPHEVVRKEEVGRTASGATIEVITLTRHVTYYGLDLTKQADVTELENRVKRTAKESCKQLDKLYPEAIYPSTPSTQNCVKKSTDEAMVQVKAAVAAAHHK